MRRAAATAGKAVRHKVGAAWLGEGAHVFVNLLGRRRRRRQRRRRSRRRRQRRWRRRERRPDRQLAQDGDAGQDDQHRCNEGRPRFVTQGMAKWLNLAAVSRHGGCRFIDDAGSVGSPRGDGGLGTEVAAQHRFCARHKLSRTSTSGVAERTRLVLVARCFVLTPPL